MLIVIGAVALVVIAGVWSLARPRPRDRELGAEHEHVPGLRAGTHRVGDRTGGRRDEQPDPLEEPDAAA